MPTHGKKFGFRKYEIGTPLSFFTDESVDEYYKVLGQIKEVFEKSIYEQERAYRAALKDLEQARDNAREEAKLCLKLKEEK